MSDTNVTFTVGQEFWIAYGRGKQRARVREITSRGGLKLDRFYGAGTNNAGWVRSNTTVSPNDPRILLQG